MAPKRKNIFLGSSRRQQQKEEDKEKEKKVDEISDKFVNEEENDTFGFVMTSSRPKTQNNFAFIDRHDEFCAMRISKQKELRSSVTMVMDRLTRLSLQTQSRSKESKSFFDRLSDSYNSLFTDEVDSLAQICPHCGQGFTLFRRRTLCKLCDMTVCSECGDFVMNLPKFNNQEVEGTVDCCRKCCDLAHSGEMKQQWDEKYKRAENHPFAKAYNSINDLQHSIKGRMKRMQDALNEATDKTSYELHEAEMHNRFISQNFVSLHSITKELDEFAPKKPEDIALQKSLKQYVTDFVARNSPTMTALQRRMKALTALEPAKKPTVSKTPPVDNNKIAQTELSEWHSTHPSPAISSITPAVIPLDGAKIEITGLHFRKGASVFIDGKKCKSSRHSEESFTVTAPHHSQGFAPLEIKNEDGTNLCLETALLYDPVGEGGSQWRAKTSILKVLSATGHFLNADKGNAEKNEPEKQNTPKLGFTREKRTTTKKDEAGDMNDFGHESGIPPPSISSVEPAVVPLDGGITVRICGENFSPGKTKVLIDGTLVEHCEFVDKDEKSGLMCTITFEAPKQKEGAKDVTVVNSDGQKYTLEKILQFVDI